LVYRFKDDEDDVQSRKLADVIRDRTGLSVLRTCVMTPKAADGPLEEMEEFSDGSVVKQLKARNADVALWGRWHKDTKTLSVHYVNAWGADSSPYPSQDQKTDQLPEFVDNRFAIELVAPFENYSIPRPEDRDDRTALLRFADKVSGFEATVNHGNKPWPAYSWFLRCTLWAVEGDLRARYAEIAHDRKSAEEAVALLENAFRAQHIDPLAADTYSYSETKIWRVFYDGALATAVKEIGTKELGDRYVTLARARFDAETEPPVNGYGEVRADAYYDRSRLGIALALRWEITKDPKDLQEGVKFLRESISLARQAGIVERNKAKSPNREVLEDSEAYKQLSKLVARGAIGSIEDQ